MSKITKATFKSFLRKNQGNLFIRVGSRFDGMTDCVQEVESPEWSPIEASDRPCENNLGIAGVWLVHGGRDYFEAVEREGFKGIRVYNCTGSFIIGTPVA